MLKMYHAHTHPGSSADYWEENWEASHFEESVRFCAVDPVRPLFEKYLRPDSLMLEGGCGSGHYVSYYTARGFNVIGLDFAQKALKTLRTRQPHVKLCGGDVSQLPFADQTFDLYYSGGVVEHFEGGAEASLHEARRVLKYDGVLLLSVPYYSPLRRVLAPFRTSEWRKVTEASIDRDEILEGKKFFQYAYRAAEFKKMLANAGLRTIQTQGYAVFWGLRELPFVNRNGQSQFYASSKNTISNEASVDLKEIIKDRPVSLPKRMAVMEDATIPVFGLGVGLLRWAAANMMMYVCKRTV